MAKSKKPAAKPAPKTPKAPPVASQALTPGTVLKKLDRAGKTRCECAVEAGGYRYKGTVHASLSGAAAAAAKDLGLSGTSFNGYVFWGLTKPGRATAIDRLEPLSTCGTATAPPRWRCSRAPRRLLHWSG